MKLFLLGRGRRGVGAGVGVDISRPESEWELGSMKSVDSAALVLGVMDVAQVHRHESMTAKGNLSVH